MNTGGKTIMSTIGIVQELWPLTYDYFESGYLGTLAAYVHQQLHPLVTQLLYIWPLPLKKPHMLVS